jgi:D-lyxose ketol-isomerase
MKRSEINRAICCMGAFAEKHGLELPPSCGWAPENRRTKGAEYDEVRDGMLGRDVTDYSAGDFDKADFSLDAIRNGIYAKRDVSPKPCAETLLYIEERPYSPIHFPWSKMEIIINRSGGNVLIRVYYAYLDEQLANTDVTLHCDGRTFTVPAGTQICLAPGESISIQPYPYHGFNVEAGSGPVLLGEVTICNDDVHGNRFLEPLGRVTAVEENEPPYRLLCGKYAAARG